MRAVSLSIAIILRRSCNLKDNSSDGGGMKSRRCFEKQNRSPHFRQYQYCIASRLESEKTFSAVLNPSRRVCRIIRSYDLPTGKFDVEHKVRGYP